MAHFTGEGIPTADIYGMWHRVWKTGDDAPDPKAINKMGLSKAELYDVLVKVAHEICKAADLSIAKKQDVEAAQKYLEVWKEHADRVGKTKDDEGLQNELRGKKKENMAEWLAFAMNEYHEACVEPQVAEPHRSGPLVPGVRMPTPWKKEYKLKGDSA